MVPIERALSKVGKLAQQLSDSPKGPLFRGISVLGRHAFAILVLGSFNPTFWSHGAFIHVLRLPIQN